MTRVFERRRIWRMAHDDFLAAAYLIARQEAARAPVSVIGVARGGVRLAEIVAKQLGVPAVTVRARHNAGEDVRQAATGCVDVDAEHNTAVLASLETGRRLLIVDDICGSGATLAQVIGQITAQVAPASVRTAVLCRNAGATYPVDSWGWDVADWVHFPWEPEPSQPTEPLPPITRLRAPARQSS